MSSLKFTARFVGMMMLLSMGFILYPQGSANAAKYCAELRGATAKDTRTARIQAIKHAERP